MKVYDQLVDALVGELLHGGIDIGLELVEIVWGKGTDVDLKTGSERETEYPQNGAYYSGCIVG